MATTTTTTAAPAMPVKRGQLALIQQRRSYTVLRASGPAKVASVARDGTIKGVLLVDGGRSYTVLHADRRIERRGWRGIEVHCRGPLANVNFALAQLVETEQGGPIGWPSGYRDSAGALAAIKQAAGMVP